MLARTVRVALALLFVAGLAGSASARPPFDFDKAPGRLPKTVVPTDYRIAIVPDVPAKTLTGTETVALLVRAPVTTIVFNSLNERLHDVRLDGAPVAGVRSDDAAQLTTVTLARPAAAGRHVLAFAYTGKLETAPQGLFVQPYRTPDGASGTMLSTQFEATDARRMFPCWDEPAFRATFELTATVPAAWSSVSNMPVRSRVAHGGAVTTTFQRSPKMPSYLVEFSAGDLARIEATARGKGFGIWAVRGQEQNGAYALANAQVILADYDAYFGYPYPLPKLDSIAVPGGFQGAMENWGAITYNDQALLLPASSTLERRQRVFSIQAHEMAHQWNGDLVTMGWWDDIWLNESFATWMAAKETALRNPSWNWWERQDEAKERAMDADARTTSHAIEQHVVNELDAEASFDPAITYSKGEAFLRMLEAYVGENAFRAGVRRYVRARAYSNATSGDLWKALGAASGSDVERIASGWTTKPGFPLVSVRASCDASGNRTIALTQKRFLLAGNDPTNARWRVPLDVRSGAAAASKRVLLVRDGQTAAAGRCDEPLSANAGDVGFYRVAYDDATFAANAKSFRALPDADKIALLDDQWALAQANQAPLGSYLTLAGSMGNDLDARAWQQIVDALGEIELDERGAGGHQAFTAYARGVIHPVFDALGWDAKPNDSAPLLTLRRVVVGDLGAWGDPAVIAEARRRFAAFVANRSTLSPDDQAVVMTIVAQNADAATFEQLHAVAKSARDEGEVRRFYPALASVRDPDLAAKALDAVMSPEVPPQAAAIRERIVRQMAADHPQLAWRFYKTHADELSASRSEFERVLDLSAAPAAFWRAAPLAELEAFVRAHVPANAGTYVARGMERARFSVILRSRLVPAADAYVTARSSPAK
jgi:aminopeptidase N